MFSNRNNQSTSPIENQDSIPASWGDFSKKLYFYRDIHDKSSNSTSERTTTRSHLNKFWIYGAIVLTYLVLIGIVVAVLILAPKYPSYYYVSPGLNVHHSAEGVPEVPVHIPVPVPSESEEEAGHHFANINHPITILQDHENVDNFPYSPDEIYQLEVPEAHEPFRPSPKDDDADTNYELMHPRSGLNNETTKS